MTRDHKWQAFSAGALAAMSVYSLIQDFVGQEGWLEFVAENWVSAAYTIPLALAALIYSMLTYAAISVRQPMPKMTATAGRPKRSEVDAGEVES